MTAPEKSSPSSEARQLSALRRQLRLSREHEGEEIKRLRALREHAERFQDLFAHAPDAFYIHDLKGVFVDGNPAAEQLVGYSREDLVGRSILGARLLNSRQLPRLVDLLETCIKGEPAGPVEVELIHRDGYAVPVEVRAYPIRMGDESLVLGIARDITRQRRSKEESLIADRLAAIAVLAGGIAHDFNNLLTAIMGNISLVSESAPPGGHAQRRLFEAEKACNRARDLTHKLLTFAEGSAPLTRPVELSPLLADLVASNSNEPSIDFELDLKLEEDLVEVDEPQFRPVLQNLLNNAMEAMPNGGKLCIALARQKLDKTSSLPLPPGAYARIDIIDQGCGIKEELLAQVFDPYFTTKETGSGLGLSITYSVVRNHGGHVTISSLPGEGTTVSIYMPLLAQENQPDPILTRLESVSTRGMRILMMDDEELIRDVGMLILKEEGYVVSLASDGEEAVELYRAALEEGHPYDAVILDLTVPGGMGGKDALMHLLKLDPKIKAIVSSGYANDPILGNYEEYGFRRAVAKPYTPQYLSAVLESLLIEDA